VGLEGWTQYFTQEIEKELIKKGEAEASKIVPELKRAATEKRTWQFFGKILAKFKF